VTTDVQKPYITYIAAGETVFPFNFTLVETADLVVISEFVQAVEYSHYTIEDLNDDGGNVVFAEAPPDGTQVLLLRTTTRSQNVDYVDGEPFPAETHEWNLDKITFILQEMLSGGFWVVDEFGNPVYLTFDLSTLAEDSTVTVVNSGGSDAVIPAWVSALTAGVFHGEISEDTSLPADEAVTAKPDGYVWIGYAP